MVIRIFEELSEDLNSIRKIQSKMKDSLIEIKNNLQRNNSRADEAQNQINDFEHKGAKNNQAVEGGKGGGNGNNHNSINNKI